MDFYDFVNNKKTAKQSINENKEKPKMIERKQVRTRNVSESRQTNYVAEADSMIENLKQKIDAVFYRFGVTGLERLDEVLCDTLNEMINPVAKKPAIKESRRLPAHRVNTVKRASKEVKEKKQQPVANDLQQSAMAFLDAAEAQAKVVEEEPKTTGKRRFGIKEATEDAITDDDLALLGAALSQK